MPIRRIVRKKSIVTKFNNEIFLTWITTTFCPPRNVIYTPLSLVGRFQLNSSRLAKGLVKKIVSLPTPPPPSLSLSFFSWGALCSAQAWYEKENGGGGAREREREKGMESERERGGERERGRERGEGEGKGCSGDLVRRMEILANCRQKLWETTQTSRLVMKELPVFFVCCPLIHY